MLLAWQEFGILLLALAQRQVVCVAHMAHIMNFGERAAQVGFTALRL